MEVSPKSRAIALVLSILLGILGVHRLYVGKIGTGIVLAVLYIVCIIVSVCTLGIGGFVMLIPCVWNLIDTICIIVGRFKDADGLPISNW